MPKTGTFGDVTVGRSEGLLKAVRIEFSGCDAPRNGPRRSTGQGTEFLAQRVCTFNGGEVAPLDEVVDHALQPHGASVVRVVDAFDAVGVEFFDFLRKDGSAAAAENADVARTALVQEVFHVLEILHVAALVGGHGNGLSVFLDGTVDHFVYTAVVAEVNDLATGTLHDAAHDVDGGIVTIEQAGSRDDANVVLGGVDGFFSLKST